jgi:molybdate transport system substrate-binding protein
MQSSVYSRVGVLLLLLTGIGSAQAEQVTVATAANFTAAMQRLAPDFERASGHKLVSSFGATGKLYAQISNGAPFDVLLSADDATPAKLEMEGFAVTGTRFTYAIGRLVLWSPQSGVVDENGAILKSGDFAHLAIANPKTAPYGAAAEQALRRLGAWDRLTPRLVYGENIAQTFQFVHTGNAQLGFVALAQVRALPPDRHGSQWLVPESLHEPLRQDAVLLKRAADKPAARAFLDYLRSPKARAIIEDLGYATAP